MYIIIIMESTAGQEDFFTTLSCFSLPPYSNERTTSSQSCSDKQVYRSQGKAVHISQLEHHYLILSHHNMALYQFSLALTGELCANYYTGLSILGQVSLRAGIQQFLSEQAITQSHQLRAGCHSPTTLLNIL